jgi:hypothetical protein
MIGMSIASESSRRKAAMPASPTRIDAPWYGGMTITIAAPSACARRLRAAQIRVE